MSSKSDVDSPSHAEVLARAERLLAASFRVSNVANFEPMTINQVHKLGGTAKDEQKKGGQNASQGTLISLGVSPDSQPGVRNSTNQKKTGNGGKSVHGEPADNRRMQFEDNRSLRSEAKHRGSLVAADNLSDIPDAVDVGTNVFITYFLHAAEIERLIVINKDQLEEAIEMENEIEQMEGAYVKASEAVTKANAELVNQRAEYEALSKSHKQSMEMMKNEAQENLLRAQAAADLLKTRHEEELHTKEEELRTRLEEELLKHVKSSGHQVEGQEDKLHAALIETKAQFLREKESFKKMAEDRLQRELLSLKNTLMVQMSAEVDRARREEQAKFDAEKQILVRELKDAHEDEKKGLETRLRTVNIKETTALRERIKSLEDQLVLKDKELHEKQRQNIVPIIETDRGSVDLCIGSELASPREYSRKKPEMRSFMSPNNSVFDQTASQKILKAQKYQPLMSSSKQRERDRSLLMDAKSAGHTEYGKR